MVLLSYVKGSRMRIGSPLGTMAITTATQKADEALEKSLPFNLISVFRPMTAAYYDVVSATFSGSRSYGLGCRTLSKTLSR